MALRRADDARCAGPAPSRGLPHAARSCRDLFVQIERRLADERPVAARGILLAQALLRDVASPLYSEETEHLLAPTLRRIQGALEP